MTQGFQGRSIVVAALYKFADFKDFRQQQQKLQELCKEQRVRGTLLLAHEGINGTIAGSREGIDAVLAYIRSLAGFADCEHKESFCDEQPFLRMKVRLKKEIVTSGVPELANPHVHVGDYLEPEAWNELIANPETIVVDTRNDYEVALGTFRGAVDPKTKTFREFPEFVEQMNFDKTKPVAMFCTGGIRCEKATAYMKSVGYENVYHLKGGILKYLETMPKDKSLWQGECFVFDNRVTVDHDLAVGHHELCHGCRNPIDDEAKLSPKYEEGVSCPQCFDLRTEAQKQSARERQKQIMIAKSRNHQHIGERRA